MPIQTQFEINPQVGYVGALARDTEPFAIDQLVAQVPASGRNPRPGDAVYWDSTNDGAAVPTSANLNETVFGIVTYFPGVVANVLSSTPSGANSASFIEYEDGASMPVIVMGTVWLLAGGALEYGNILRWNTSNFDWETVAKPTAFTDLIAKPVECVDLAVADTEIFKARIGYGRIF